MSTGTNRRKFVFTPQMTDEKPNGWIGIEANERHQDINSVFSTDRFTLSIVEFDDEGRCYDRQQMHAFENLLQSLKGKDAVIVVFVPGWKHNARSDDDNLQDFCKVLDNTAVSLQADGSARPVVGVFVGWRGKSFYCSAVTNLTFWDRKLAGQRVAAGASRELFERLRQFRRQEVNNQKLPAFIVIGHSFGGLIVYSALAQSLVSAAITPEHEVAPSFANLILLVNPAFEAVRYLPIHDLVVEREKGGLGVPQSPVFVSVTAQNDFGTKRWFPLGMFFSRIQESARGAEESQAMWHTMGHLKFLQTHELSLKAFGKSKKAMLERKQFSERNPFWVVSATPNIVDDHNGIWKPDFVDWVTELITKQLQGPQNPMLTKARLASSSQTGLLDRKPTI